MKTLIIFLVLIPFSIFAQTVTPVKRNDFSFLKNEISNDTKFVFLGEANHRYKKIFDTQIDIIKYLVDSMGYNMVTFESSYYNLEKANENIEKGASKSAEYKSNIFPIWTQHSNFDTLVNFLDDRDIKIRGFDNQFTNRNLRPHISGDFNKYHDQIQNYELWEEAVIQVGETYIPKKGVTYSDLHSIHQKLFEVINKDQKIDIKRRDFLIATLSNINSLIEDYYRDHIDTLTNDTFKAYNSNTRDSLMAENLERLSNNYPNKKIICIGANGHFAKDTKFMDPSESKKYKPMGERITEKYGDKSVFILAITGFDDMYTITPSIEKSFHKKNFKYGYKSLNEKSNFSSYAYDLNTNITFDWSNVFDGLFLIHNISDYTNVTFADQNTKQGIPYLHILNDKNKLIGVCDINGEYNFLNSKKEIITLSGIGYEPKTIDTSSLNDTLFLNENSRILGEVEIYSKGISAKKIMKNVRKNISKNYNQEGFVLAAENELINETDNKILKRRLYDEIDPNGYSDLNYVTRLMFKVDEWRYIKNDTSITCVAEQELDSLRYSNFIIGTGSQNLKDIIDVRHHNFLNSKHNYQFILQENEYINKKLHYVVYFKAENPGYKNTGGDDFIDIKNYSGKLYVNASNYAITKAVINTIYNPRNDINIMTDNFHELNLKNKQFSHETFYYKKTNGFYYLSKHEVHSNLGKNIVSKTTYKLTDKPPKPFK
ncbi:erythromycin esterase family protein [Flammeovirga kamogawensis]|uniref:Erythromycin esterase family protein n=1 Tax=Flammeovirga kamogawensis TaxID=373891 RepID=A0ABX8H0R4_9BACT|nr:erythromycin esterase family protein [Flammeovirga kamogawensis]MBB6462368.1 hypothetical protein [Flammeovirga kamogawensis]QWG09481.1 erythromycin esterase family protein [Flammeovirga kamogawensis]TRX64997.1 erythromycin esterase family protein [Flammeovirga kamogawensis]